MRSSSRSVRRGRIRLIARPEDVEEVHGKCALRAAARYRRTLRLSHVTRDNGAIEGARIIEEVAETAPRAAPSPACKFNRLALRAEPTTHQARIIESFPRWDQINASKDAAPLGIQSSRQPSQASAGSIAISMPPLPSIELWQDRRIHRRCYKPISCT
jgi:hypothetical protein